MIVARRPILRIGDAVRWTAQRTGQGTPKPWTCPHCTCRAPASRNGRSTGARINAGTDWRRPFSNTVRLRQDEKKAAPSKSDTISIPPSQPSQAEDATPDSIPSSPQPAIVQPSKTPAEKSDSLPSVSESKRSPFSRRTSKILDELLVKASEASKYINAHTGTDYSGIEALRQEIVQQEEKVRTYYVRVEEKRNAHSEAHRKQSAAQREIVALLERKSSWTPGDLERYMSLVRSEHLNEQDVMNAKEDLSTAEKELEDSRLLLERLRGKQYHEEQIWSDTIRRNGTWITFGLMGVNILLLLAQIAIFEPYRRKKITRNVEAGVEARVEALLDRKLGGLSVKPETERQIDQVVVSKEVVPEESQQPLNAILPATGNDAAGNPPIAAAEILPPEASKFAGAVPEAPSKQEIEPPKQYITDAAREVVKGSWESYDEYLRDLWSERIVQMRKVDVTNTALQGAATGVAIMGILFILFRPQ
ncbi:uncharacterized protein MYCFIDRAFT_157381 [Pseudocercospora fijiensis CIRAD86]|uniref:Sensitive to high expression protein 9, mitochondrial n=1 Tax=Pseudocercospora fijiensis (strain CIRAD86) TaxID=383855 RepID=M3A2K9_PSEFD|nr:uncharacterized protein MYCFIDRAFT_157381 [Pseudocercospora fijiensis CIRAD86]EME78626.1 hypothetical protein MYCFIDRAFT_157381 [Pseudocercospora fijiensis CIRAD86]